MPQTLQPLACTRSLASASTLAAASSASAAASAAESCSSCEQGSMLIARRGCRREWSKASPAAQAAPASLSPAPHLHAQLQGGYVLVFGADSRLQLPAATQRRTAKQAVSARSSIASHRSSRRLLCLALLAKQRQRRQQRQHTPQARTWRAARHGAETRWPHPSSQWPAAGRQAGGQTGSRAAGRHQGACTGSGMHRL